MPSTHRGDEVGDNHFNRKQDADKAAADEAARQYSQRNDWKKGFIGTYHGDHEGRGFFSAEATGGAESDSIVIPWSGPPHTLGQKFAMIPSQKPWALPGHDLPIPKGWNAHVINPERHSGLAGYNPDDFPPPKGAKGA